MPYLNYILIHGYTPQEFEFVSSYLKYVELGNVLCVGGRLCEFYDLITIGTLIRKKLRYTRQFTNKFEQTFMRI